MMKHLFGFLLLIAATATWAQNQVNSMRVWSDQGHTRLVVETASPAKYKLIRLSGPDRLVVDLSDTKLKTRMPQSKGKGSLVKKVRSGVRNGDDLRLVLDLYGPTKSKIFQIKKDSKNPNRLVVDLFGKGVSAPVVKKTLPVAPPKKRLSTQPQQMVAKAGKAPAPKPINSNLRNATGRDLVIAIDAGHGGKDPGAVGKRGAREKDVVLAISKKIAGLINRQKGMKAVLIRKGDYFLSLGRRVQLAHKHDADLFISIHADAFENSNVRGSSVYTLSNRGATSLAAKMLAQRENRSDEIGGIELKEQSNDLAKVLIDLAQTGSRDASYEVAGSVLSELRRVGKVHNRKVQKAGFAVLKSASIPSILVETAYISNPEEERKLKDSRHQTKLANSIMRGVQRYFKYNPVPGSLLAGQTNHEYIVSGGDTLEQVARKFNLDVSELKSYNALSNDKVRVGQVLQIPKS